MVFVFCGNKGGEVSKQLGETIRWRLKGEFTETRICKNADTNESRRSGFISGNRAGTGNEGTFKQF